jgi:hypothetical protein
VEKEASGSDEQIANKRHQKDSVMPILHTVVDALERKVHEKEVCQGIDDFSGIDCGIVVLFAPV